MYRAVGIGALLLAISAPSYGQPRDWPDDKQGQDYGEQDRLRDELSLLRARVDEIEAQQRHPPSPPTPLAGVNLDDLSKQGSLDPTRSRADEDELVDAIASSVPRVSLDGQGLATPKPEETTGMLAYMLVAIGGAMSLLLLLWRRKHVRRTKSGEMAGE